MEKPKIDKDWIALVKVRFKDTNIKKKIAENVMKKKDNIDDQLLDENRNDAMKWGCCGDNGTLWERRRSLIERR